MKEVFVIFAAVNGEWDVVAIFDTLESAQKACKGSTIHVIKSFTIGSFMGGKFEKAI